MRVAKFYSVPFICLMGALVVGSLSAQDLTVTDRNGALVTSDDVFRIETAISSTSTSSCDTTNGTRFNLEPRLNALPQNTESVDFLLNRVAPGVDLVVGAANDQRSTLGGFDAYYVHRAGFTCNVDFEGTLSTAAIDPTVVADPARDAFFLADNLLSLSQIVELARTTSATLLSSTACPNGTQLNGSNPNCWPVLATANFTNSNVPQAALLHSHLAVDPRTSGTGAGDVYVAAQIENTGNFPATANVQLAACTNRNLTCGAPVVVSGTDTFGSYPYVQVRADGLLTISYWTYTKPFGTQPNPIDIKFVTCRAQGAPKAPICSTPTLVATSNVVPGFAPGDSGFNNHVFPKHVNRRESDGKSFTTFLVYDRCRSIVGPRADAVAPVCSKVDVLLTESTNEGMSWSLAEPVESATGHQFFGTIRLDVSTSTTNIAYYSTQNDAFLQRPQVFLSQIPAGTTKVNPAIPLTSASTDPDAGIQDFTLLQAFGVVNFGDRIGLAAAGTGTKGRSRLYVHYTWNNVFGISNSTQQPDPNNTVVPFSY